MSEKVLIAKEKIATITKDKKELLSGFKVLGMFPFYVKYLRGETKIDLSLIQAKIRAANGGGDVYEDTLIDNAKLKYIIPLIEEYLTIGLINSRFLGKLFKFFIKQKVKSCSEEQKSGLYVMLYKLQDASFFLSYFRHLVQKEHTILKEVKAS